MVFKKKQSAVDEQIAEIDKLNAVINAAERDMLKLRKVWVVFTRVAGHHASAMLKVWVVFIRLAGYHASAMLKVHTVALTAQSAGITHAVSLRSAISFCCSSKQTGSPMLLA